MRSIEPTRPSIYCERFLGFRKSQSLVFIELQTGAFLKVSASFKRGRAFGSLLHWGNLLEMRAYQGALKHFYAAYGVPN
jgi:hypothetical protein